MCPNLCRVSRADVGGDGSHILGTVFLQCVEESLVFIRGPIAGLSFRGFWSRDFLERDKPLSQSFVFEPGGVECGLEAAVMFESADIRLVIVVGCRRGGGS